MPELANLEPVPDWLRRAAGPWGARLRGLRRGEGPLQIALDADLATPLVITVHSPDVPRLPFAGAHLGLGYRSVPGGVEARLGELCRQLGQAIEKSPEAAEQLFALARLDPKHAGSTQGAASTQPRDVLSVADAAVFQALECVARRDLLGALTAWRGAEGAHEAFSAVASPVLERVAGRVPHEPLPPPPPLEEPRSEAWERAWAGDLAGALRHASSDDAEAVRGVVSLLEGRPHQALPLLERALQERPDANLALHRARALAQLGRLAEAQRALADLSEGESLGRRVLTARLDVESAPRGALRFAHWRRRVRASHTRFNGLFATELPALLDRSTLARALKSPASTAAMLDGLLDRMAGNLGPSPTFAVRGPDGVARFDRITLPPTSRNAAIDALHSVRHWGPAGAEAALAAELARHPRSVQAHCYRGELYLWLGRYEEAMRAFAAARWIEPTRWADIGMLAVLLFTGRHVLALGMARYAAYHFPPVAGGSLPVYRGALYRRMGALGPAVRDLRTAVAVKPTRVGARIELVLALRAAGHASEAREHAEQLVRDAAPLLVDAAHQRGLQGITPSELLEDATLEAALHAMRGNRSSSLVTWLDGAGTLRVIEPPSQLAQRARRALEKLRPRSE